MLIWLSFPCASSATHAQWLPGILECVAPVTQMVGSLIQASLDNGVGLQGIYLPFSPV